VGTLQQNPREREIIEKALGKEGRLPTTLKAGDEEKNGNSIRLL